MIYLFRHGQAGTRENYDQLSLLGQEQAAMLGQYLAQQAITFDAVFTGTLQRQQHTAQLALTQTPEAVAPGVDQRWNEFSLADVYHGMLPLLLRDDECFAADYAEMQNTLRDDPHAVRGAVGRCDRAVIETWMTDRYAEYQGERWRDFRARAQNALADLLKLGSEHDIAVFTSATPIAICVSAILELNNTKTLGLMAMLQNTSITTLRVREGEAWLFNFNAMPHLATPALRTYR